MKRTVFFLIGMITIIIFATPASAKLYKYTDNRGIVRYADNIEAVPERYRSQITPPGPAVSEKTVVPKKATAPKGPAIKAPAVAAPALKTPAVKKSAEIVTPPVPVVSEKTVVPKKATAAKGPAIEAPAVAAPAPKTPAVRKSAEIVTAPAPTVPEKTDVPEKVAAPKGPAIEAPAVAVPVAAPGTGPKIFVEKPVAPAPSQTPETYDEAPPVHPSVETARLTPTTAPEQQADIDINLLIDKRNRLLEKKETLDKTFLSLLAEKQTLETERTKAHDQQSIQKYNNNVTRLNERIKRFKVEDLALRDEIEHYNMLIKAAR